MTRRQPVILGLWSAVWLCAAVAAQAQTAMSDSAASSTPGRHDATAIASASPADVHPETAIASASPADVRPETAMRPPVADVHPEIAMRPAAAEPMPSDLLSRAQIRAGASGLVQPDTPPAVSQAVRPETPVGVRAQTASTADLPSRQLILEVGSGRMVSLSMPAASIFAADPRVAEVRPASATSLFILGVGPGRTTIAAIDDAGAAFIQFDVTVRASGFAAVQAERAIGRLLPRSVIHVTMQPNGLAISGSVPVAGDADIAMQTARDFVGAGQIVENRLVVLGSQQVNLRVRIAEVSRAVVRNLGVNWSALGNIGTFAKFAPFPALAAALNGGGATSIIVPPANPYPTFSAPPANNPLSLGGNINAVIDALAQDNLAHVLAEPNLTALSGETASFLVGGEFPIPVAQQNNQISIEFKQYGVSLAFVPTVVSEGRINMKVRPEVSALTSLGAVQLGVGNSTISVPALTVRRAETTVELASGQSFAIAGLLQDNTTMAVNALPGIGELPILGALFRSDAFQRNETELVILVTPYLVSGVANPDRLKLPGSGWKPPNDLERILLLRQSAQNLWERLGGTAHSRRRGLPAAMRKP